LNRSYNAAESADIRDTIVPKQKDRLAAVSPDLLALLDVQTLSDFIHSALPEHKACPLVAGFEIHLRPEEPGPNVLIVHDLF
jgi:hypothetical protein